MTMSTNLGWPSEPEPSPEHRRLGWLARMLGGVSRETEQAAGPQDGVAGESEVPRGEAPEAVVTDATLVAHEPTRSDVDRSEPGALEALEDADGSAHGHAAPAADDEQADDPAPEVLASEPAPVGPAPGRGDGQMDGAVDDDRTAAPGPDDETNDEEERPVDNTVDDAPENTLSTQAEGALAAGDNVVDDEARRRAYADGHAEREALVAALPTGDDDTPLARELADNARRRIQLTGRPFPKPASPRVLTVANQKGGVGKTTTTVNVAAALAQSGLTVLVIDLDPQGNASTALGIDHHAEVPSIYDVLVDGTPLLDVIQPCTTVDRLFCAPATIDLAGAEIELVSLVARETRLQKAIAAASEAGHSYDYILIDCPPSLGLLTVNAMVAASEVFIPIQCEYYALEGLSQLLKNIELVRAHLNPPLHVSTILLTMYDGRTRLSAQVAEEVREHFPEQVLRTTVPRSVRISEAPSFGETVMTYDSTSSGALAYLEAAGEMADRGAVGAA